mgnify:CR=1 FL=1
MIDLKIELPESFLEEEVRCGYTITRKMKEVWAVELDLLSEFQRVCEKYNLRYCADGGTLLGAVRHQGYIPWDDDLDIAMLRSDFEKLNKIAPLEFKKPYFWQTEETDPGSARGHAQLRNSDTTSIITLEYEHQRHNNFNQGIFIDIFPFDTVIDDERKLIEQDQKRLALNSQYRKMLDSVDFFCFKPWIDDKGKWHLNLKKLCHHFKYKLCGKSYVSAYYEFIDEITKYNYVNDSEYVADFCMPLPLKRIKRFRTDFEKLEMVDFEFIQIPIFKNYDRNLRNIYGEQYMIPVKANSEHGGLILDTDNSYICYLKQRK